MTFPGQSLAPGLAGPSHAWNVSPAEALHLQQLLRRNVRLEPLAAEPTHIAGADVSMDLYSNVIFAGFIVLTYPELKPVDHSVVQDTTSFPYVPGLLSFREIPALLRAWTGLTVKPGVVVVDGAGIAHPRRLGIASHLGVLLDVPTIGCAKSRLTGRHAPLPAEAGTMVPLLDDVTREHLGDLLRSRRGANPLYISPGHRVTAAEALALIRRCLKGYRLPEPTRLAHLLVNDHRRLATGRDLVTDELPSD